MTARNCANHKPKSKPSCASSSACLSNATLDLPTSMHDHIPADRDANNRPGRWNDEIVERPRKRQQRSGSVAGYGWNAPSSRAGKSTPYKNYQPSRSRRSVLALSLVYLGHASVGSGGGLTLCFRHLGDLSVAPLCPHTVHRPADALAPHRITNGTGATDAVCVQVARSEIDPPKAMAALQLAKRRDRCRGPRSPRVVVRGGIKSVEI